MAALRVGEGAEVLVHDALHRNEEAAALAGQDTRLDEVARAHVEDLREEFVRDFVFPMFRANTIYEGEYLLGTSIARPLIAKRLVEIAAEHGADAVSHGATGKGNDQVRFELTFRALSPELEVIAPWREWDLQSRPDCIAYCQKHGIPVTATLEKPYSIDRNLLHISFEGGVLEDPWNEPEEEMFLLSVSPEAAPDTPEYVEVEFEAGTPVAVNGETLSPADLLTRLNRVAGEHGIGRVDMVENRFVGLKSRGVYETPGGTVLHAAHRAVESITMDRDVMHERDRLAPRLAELIYNGFWFAPEMEALRAFVDASQRNVTGEARLRLYKGNVIVTGRWSEGSIYSEDHVTFEEDSVYDQANADGFIKLNSLRLRLLTLRDRKLGR